MLCNTHSPGLFRRCSLSMFDTTKEERKRKSEEDWDKQNRNQRGEIETQRDPVLETDKNIGNLSRMFHPEYKKDRTAASWLHSEHYVLVLHHWTNTLASEDRQKRDTGVNKGFYFIPSLSILSTASLTRRMTVTMEAGQNTERKERGNTISVFMNRVWFHEQGVTEMRWRVCLSMCVHTCWEQWRHVTLANTFLHLWCVCMCVCVCERVFFY